MDSHPQNLVLAQQVLDAAWGRDRQPQSERQQHKQASIIKADAERKRLRNELAGRKGDLAPAQAERDVQPNLGSQTHVLEIMADIRTLERALANAEKIYTLLVGGDDDDDEDEPDENQDDGYEDELPSRFRDGQFIGRMHCRDGSFPIPA